MNAHTINNNNTCEQCRWKSAYSVIYLSPELCLVWECVTVILDHLCNKCEFIFAHLFVLTKLMEKMCEFSVQTNKERRTEPHRIAWWKCKRWNFPNSVMINRFDWSSVRPKNVYVCVRVCGRAFVCVLSPTKWLFAKSHYDGERFFFRVKWKNRWAANKFNIIRF